jgi:hypothetical protein
VTARATAATAEDIDNDIDNCDNDLQKEQVVSYAN